jgi:isoquinoline 1-oxidoreductase alpha subunit
MVPCSARCTGRDFKWSRQLTEAGPRYGPPRQRVANSRRLILATLKINGEDRTYEAPDDTPLLWVIREELKLTGTKFGCGVGLCGACVVHIDGKRAFSCQTQVSNVAGKEVTTIEGLSPDSSHPVQKAWLAERVPQCGYCQSGQIMSAADLLKWNPRPTRAAVRAQMTALRRLHQRSRCRGAQAPDQQGGDCRGSERGNRSRQIEPVA